MIDNEVDLLKNYPKTKRNVHGRQDEKTAEDRDIARQFGREFFDGDRKHGYGGFHYHSRFWQQVVKDISDYYQLAPDAKILDVGCAKGFMLYDFLQLMPDLTVSGIDVSQYAIENAMEAIKPFVQVGNAVELPFADNSFDLVLAINTIHNLDKEACRQSLKEIERVSRGKSFITVDAYRNEVEKERMFAWNLTAKTIMHVDDWKVYFCEAGYTGDYFWFMP